MGLRRGTASRVASRLVLLPLCLVIVVEPRWLSLASLVCSAYLQRRVLFLLLGLLPRWLVPRLVGL